MRDSDKSLAYEAEHLVWQETLFDEPMGGGVILLANRIMAHPWWQEAHGGLAPDVRPARREAGRSIAYGARAVSLSIAGEKAWVLTHELAHSIHRHHRLGGAAHGVEWRAIYVDLTRLVAGQAMATGLAASFASRGLTSEASLPYQPAPTVAEYGLYELHRLDETTGRVA